MFGTKTTQKAAENEEQYGARTWGSAGPVHHWRCRGWWAWSQGCWTVTQRSWRTAQSSCSSPGTSWRRTEAPSTGGGVAPRAWWSPPAKPRWSHSRGFTGLSEFVVETKLTLRVSGDTKFWRCVLTSRGFFSSRVLLCGMKSNKSHILIHCSHQCGTWRENHISQRSQRRVKQRLTCRTNRRGSSQGWFHPTCGPIKANFAHLDLRIIALITKWTRLTQFSANTSWSTNYSSPLMLTHWPVTATGRPSRRWVRTHCDLTREIPSTPVGSSAPDCSTGHLNTETLQWRFPRTTVPSTAIDKLMFPTVEFITMRTKRGLSLLLPTFNTFNNATAVENENIFVERSASDKKQSNCTRNSSPFTRKERWMKTRTRTYRTKAADTRRRRFQWWGGCCWAAEASVLPTRNIWKVQHTTGWL